MACGYCLKYAVDRGILSSTEEIAVMDLKNSHGAKVFLSAVLMVVGGATPTSDQKS